VGTTIFVNMGWTANSRKADRPMVAVKTGRAAVTGLRASGLKLAERSSNDFSEGMEMQPGRRRDGCILRLGH
jgi:hypothetical protein